MALVFISVNLVCFLSVLLFWRSMADTEFLDQDDAVDSEIRCNTTAYDACQIDCIGANACKEFNLYCAPYTPCTINCNGNDESLGRACNLAKVFAMNTSFLKLYALDRQDFRDGIVNGPWDGGNLYMFADEKWGLSGVVVNASGANNVTIDCQADLTVPLGTSRKWQCSGLKLYGEDANYVNFFCTKDAWCNISSSNEITEIYCPQNSPSDDTCNIVVESNGHFNHAKVYSKGGIPSDLKMKCGNASNACPDTTIFCGSSYNQFCNMTFNDSIWSCIGNCDTPTQSPSRTPTSTPTAAPTAPSTSPTIDPTAAPTGPSTSPTTSPTDSPVISPTMSPTMPPTKSPTVFPTVPPTKNPTVSPTMSPTVSPTKNPTMSPTVSPTISPTIFPTEGPTKFPTNSPTLPTGFPTRNPTMSPTTFPTKDPTKFPTISPTKHPSSNPSSSPTQTPTANPSKTPTNTPTKAPNSNSQSSVIDFNNAAQLSVFIILLVVICVLIVVLVWVFQKNNPKFGSESVHIQIVKGETKSDAKGSNDTRKENGNENEKEKEKEKEKENEKKKKKKESQGIIHLQSMSTNKPEGESQSRSVSDSSTLYEGNDKTSTKKEIPLSVDAPHDRALNEPLPLKTGEIDHVISEPGSDIDHVVSEPGSDIDHVNAEIGIDIGPKPVQDWGIQEVADWIREVTKEWPESETYANSFKEQRITGEGLMDLTEAMLKGSLGVVLLGHRLKILRKRKKLGNGEY